MRVGRSAGLVAALASSLVFGACSNPDSNTVLRPEGPPEIRQLFVLNTDGVSVLAYGNHPDIVDENLNDSVVPPYSNQVGWTTDAGCNFVEVPNALVTGQRIRVVIDELLEGGMFEQF